MSEKSEDTNQSGVADAVFRVLSDSYRRLALYYLTEQESTTVEKLATVLTGWMQAHEEGVTIGTPADRKRIQIALQHVHLPIIEAEEFVRYDPESGEVALDSVPELLESIIERSLADERRERSSDDSNDFGDDGFDSDGFGTGQGHSGDE